MKFLHIYLFSFLINFVVYAQRSDRPFEIQIGYGIPFELPRTNVLPNYNQIDFRFQKKITNHFLLGFEFQYSKNNFKKEFILNFQKDFVESQSLLNFNDYSVRKGIINFGYALNNKKGNLETGFVLGLGLESFRGDYSFLYAYYEPFGSVNISEKDYINHVIQFNLENTFYFYKNIGINFSLKTQYSILKDPVIFSGIFSQGNGDIPLTKEVVSIKENYFTIIPTLGIKYSFK